MTSASDIRVEPVSRSEADACMRAWHYSKKGYCKSVLHMGVLLDGRIVGAMSWGPGIDTRKSIAQIPGTAWDGYMELNRMALSPAAPRCSESRALGVAVRAIARWAPHVEWLVSYADGAQSGSGVIYRASGWTLTQWRQNGTLFRDVLTGAVVSSVGIRTSIALRRVYGTARSDRLVRLDGVMRRYHLGLSPRARRAIADLACADTEMVSAVGPPQRAFDSTYPLYIDTQIGDRPSLREAVAAIPRYSDPCGATSRSARAAAIESRAHRRLDTIADSRATEALS